MSNRRTYPESVVEVLDDRMTFKPEALQAMRRFVQSHPWRGSTDERKQKFEALVADLSAAYCMQAPTITFGELDGSCSGRSHYIPAENRIVLVGRLSVVTLLHEFGHARGMGERSACRWSLNLFRRSCPRAFSRLIHIGHMVVRPADLPAVTN